MHADLPEFPRATRVPYDAFADDRTARFADGPAALPPERALLTAFADLARTVPGL
ncbi:MULTISPECIES: hypothetical protein [unclassified Streptomyces]|uniref:hypothetical protein n=1 Tax=unclassified Streptomyces TaxID=2593676 RepID=UPI00133123D1|nr:MULTISPECIES: hypothetical protein [unclassified Streptomyces]MCP3766642.1 hypothetical protein [Streptomyces sp. MAR25Y5]